MTKAIVSFLLSFFLSIPVFAQPGWESIAVGTATEFDPDWIVLIMDPDIDERSRTDFRYKRIKLLDLFRGLIRFPDNFPRYVSVHNTDRGLSIADLTTGTGVDSVIGFNTGVRVPSWTSSDRAYIVIAVPDDGTRWSGTWSFGNDLENPGGQNAEFGQGNGLYEPVDWRRDTDLDFVQIIDGETVNYMVWRTDYYESSWRFTSQSVYFDINAVPPIGFPTIDADSATYTVYEGDPLVFRASLVGDFPRREDVSIGYTTRGTGPFTPTSGTLTFSPWESSKTITVPTTENTQISNSPYNERVDLYFRNPDGIRITSEGYFSYPGEFEGDIRDDDRTDRSILSLSGSSAEEGEDLSFSVTLPVASSEPFSVRAYAVSGVASSRTDYTFVAETIEFDGTSGETHTFTIPTIEDDTPEGDEHFVVGVGSAAALANSVYGIITDDDGGYVIISDAEADEGDAITFTATLTKAVSGGLTVTPSFLDVSAIKGTDYVQNVTPLEFDGTVGEMETFTVPTREDTDDEEDETFVVFLAISATSQAVTAPFTAVGTIRDDD